MKRAGLYVRVSTEEQKREGLSIDNQISALKKFCEENGLKAVEIYNDAGISGRKSYKKRPAMQRMIKDCQSKKIDIILITRLDRFFRSVSDYYAVMEQTGNVPWRAIWEDYETETSSGVFKVNIMLSIAQAEADRTSEKIRSVMQYKKEKGDTLGAAPTGYIKKDSKLFIDESKAETVRTVFEVYQRTWSATEVVRALQDKGINSITRKTVSHILTNHVYTGHEGGHDCEGYVSVEDFEMIQKSVDKRRIRISHGKKYNYVFGGLLRCGYCGGSLASKGRVRRDREYKNYACSGIDRKENTHLDRYVSVSEITLEKQMLDRFDSIMREYNAHVDVATSDTTDNKQKIKKLEGRLERIKILFEDGDIEKDEYRKKRDAINAEIQDLKNSMQSKQDIIALPDNWKDIYMDLTTENRRAFWGSMIDHITITRENKNSLSFNDITFL